MIIFRWPDQGALPHYGYGSIGPAGVDRTYTYLGNQWWGYCPEESDTEATLQRQRRLLFEWRTSPNHKVHCYTLIDRRTGVRE